MLYILLVKAFPEVKSVNNIIICYGQLLETVPVQNKSLWFKNSSFYNEIQFQVFAIVRVTINLPYSHLSYVLNRLVI